MKIKKMNKLYSIIVKYHKFPADCDTDDSDSNN